MPDKKKLFLLVEECSSANRKSFFIGMKVMFNSVELMFRMKYFLFHIKVGFISVVFGYFLLTWL